MTYSVLNHKVYGKVLSNNGRMYVIEQKKYEEAKALSEEYNGSPIKTMAKNWIIKINEEVVDKPHKILKKNKYKGIGPSVKSINEWMVKPEIQSLYLERYGSEDIASKEIQVTGKKLIEAFNNNEIIHNKKTISQIRKG